MDIAWKAEAYEASEGVVVYVATAPSAQQRAAFELLVPQEITLHDGMSLIADGQGGFATLAHVSMARDVFERFDVMPARSRGKFRSVVLTKGFDAGSSMVYMRRMAEALGESRRAERGEAGFVGLCGVPPETKQEFFGALPREPMPLSDFLSVVARAASSANR